MLCPAKAVKSTSKRACTYYATPIVIAKDNVTLVGAGYGTVLFLADNAQKPCIVVGDIRDEEREHLDTHRNIIIRDLQIDGNRANQPPDEGGEYDLTRPWLRNNGITVRKVTNSLIENCLIRNCRSGGLVLEKGCSHNQIVNVMASGNYFDGVCAYESSHCVFDAVDASDNDYAGFSFDLWSDENIVKNCIAIGNGHSGFFIAHCTKLIISDCQFSDSGNYDGIFLSSGSSENVIANCYFKTNKRYGVNIVDADCTNNLVHGCYFWYNEAGSINGVAGAEPYDYDNIKLES